MSYNKNAVATPLTELAYKLHVNIYNSVYPCPLHLKFENGQASIKLENVFQLKYFPFLLIFVLFTSIITPGSCLFLLGYKLFKPYATSAGVLELVVCGLIGSCVIYQVFTGLLYIPSKEIDVAMNQMFFMEQKYYNFKPKKSMDWLGLFYLFLQPSCLVICVIAPLIAVLTKLDPLYYVLEIILPSSTERSSYFVYTIIVFRVLTITVLAYECSRISVLHMFVFQSLIITISTCLHKISQNIFVTETKTLKLYSMLRVLMKSSDFFTRYVFCYLLVFQQIVITLSMWLVIKCWDILPIYITILFELAASSTLVTIILIVPPAVEIGEASENFVKGKRALYHTFNRGSRRYNCFLRWCSQRMLPIRFGTYFIMNTRTPINYLEVLMINLTNAILLINP